LYGGGGDGEVSGTEGVGGNDLVDGGDQTVGDACDSDVGDVESNCES
jgi:hypothetical protein